MTSRPPKPEGRPAAPRFKKKRHAEAAAARSSRVRPMKSINWLDILHEMDAGDHRTSAVVAASLLENNLGVAITGRLKELSDAQHRDLFDDDRSVLGTFSAKIEIGFALNLFNDDVKHDLDTIRRVRNNFAHSLEVRDFDHADVRDDCDKLFGPKFFAWAETKGKPGESNRRQRYLNTAAHLTARFDMEAHNHYRPPPASVQTYEMSPASLPGKRG